MNIVLELKFIKSFLQDLLPGLALKIFFYILPTVLMIMSKIEGYIALSTLERKTAAKYYYFMLVNVFLGSIVTGTAFQQLHAFLHQSPTQILRTIGVSIPMKATFFMTYIMVDGWAGIAGEILRLKPLVIYHLKNMLSSKVEYQLPNLFVGAITKESLYSAFENGITAEQIDVTGDIGENRIIGQSDVSGNLKVSDRVQDRLKEGKLLSSGSRNNLEEKAWKFCKIFLSQICVVEVKIF
ncbi:CSC1-like protein [Glycine soja]